jgi:NAD(P)-dependent dehydrogenase (short-subunit alcohol dehydrogenase family)
MNIDISGKTALVTGSTAGIGYAIAKGLAASGASVVLNGRKQATVDVAVAKLTGEVKGAKVRGIAADVSAAEGGNTLVKALPDVDILINNAGIYPFGPTHEMTEDLFDRVFSLNLKAPYFLVAELAPLMATRGKGAIVNLSTMVADYGAPGMSLYGSSKAAINLLTKTWAAEYGPKGVRVNVVSPGPTRTEGTDAMGEGLEQLASQAPAGRPATADEIAEAIVFLATDRSSFVYGAKLAVDGGRTAI